MSTTVQPPGPPPPPQTPPPRAGGKDWMFGAGVVVALLVLFGWLLVGPPMGDVLRRIGVVTVARTPPALEPPPALRELFDANNQHLQIAATIGACQPGLVVDAFSPPSVAGPLLIGLNFYGGYEHGRGGQDDPPATVTLTGFQAAVLRLSDATSRARLQSIRVADEQGERMATYQWAAVLIGAVTTILVGLRSVANIPAPVFLGALAIVFSALGTGCTTINSFFAPADAFSRADRSLAQLRLLHRERAVGLLMGIDVCGAFPRAPAATAAVQPAQGTPAEAPPAEGAQPRAPAAAPTAAPPQEDNRVRFVREWDARLTEIVTAAGAAAQPAVGALSGGAPPPPTPR